MATSVGVVHTYGIDCATGSPSFKKSTIKLTTEEISERAEDLFNNISGFLDRFIRKGIKLIGEFAEYSDKRNRSIKYFIYSSIISTVTHIILQGIIMSKYVHEDIFRSMTAFLCVICVFTLFNFCLTCPCSSVLKKSKERLALYSISLCMYLKFFCDVASFLRKNDYVYFLGSLILFFSCASIHGIVAILTGVAFLIYGILYWSCRPILYLSITCCCNSKEVETKPTIYLYDSSKTNEKHCGICLQDYKKSEKIRVCKVHLTHIFHEDCISEWVSTKPTCPLCGDGQPAIFH